MTDHVPSPTTREPSNDVSMDGPNVRKAFAPEVTSWTLVPFGDYLWHLPTTLVKQIEAEAEAAAAPQARVRALETALRNLRMDVWHADYCAVGDGHCICGLTAAIVEADRVLAAEQPTPERDGGLDVERLARAIDAHKWGWLGWTDQPDMAERRAEAIHNAATTLAAEYARLAASPATPADPETPE